MPIHSVFSLICQRFGQTARFVSAAILLLLVVHSKSSASTLYSSGHGIPPNTSLIATLSAPDGSYSTGFQEGSNNKDSLDRKATFLNNSSSQTGTILAPAAETATGERPASAVATGKPAPDWDGVWRDTGIVFGAQVAAVGITYVMPQSFSSWTPEQKKNAFKKYADNFVSPVLDKDKFYVNYVLHPYWGATYYIRGRERGLDQISSLIYSTALSAMYEFGVECIAEKPSIQDLIITPGLGALLGAYIFEPWRESIKRKQELRWYDHTVLVLTDPLGVLSLGVEKIFGIKSTIMVDYSTPQLQNRSTGSAVASKSNRIGVVLQFPLN